MLVRKMMWPVARAAERWEDEFGTAIPYTFHFFSYEPGSSNDYLLMGEPFWVEHEVDEQLCFLKEVELLERMKERAYEQYQETKLRIDERLSNLRCIGIDTIVREEASDL